MRDSILGFHPEVVVGVVEEVELGEMVADADREVEEESRISRGRRRKDYEHGASDSRSKVR